MNQSADGIAVEDAGEVARGLHIEDEDGHIAVAAEGESGTIHYLEVLGKGLVEGELIVFDRRGVLFGIGGPRKCTPFSDT